MQPIVVKPEQGQKTIWLIGWTIWFAPVCVLWLALMLAVHPLGFGLCLLGWLVLMVPIGLWIPAFHRSLEYVIEADCVRGRKGVFWTRHVAVPYTKITNVDVTQGPVQRMFNIGTVHAQTAGAGGEQGARAELSMLGVRDLDGLKDTIMQRVKGLTPSRTDEVKETVIEESHSQLSRDVLEELRAIRKLLENKQS